MANSMITKRHEGKQKDGPILILESMLRENSKTKNLGAFHGFR